LPLPLVGAARTGRAGAATIGVARLLLLLGLLLSASWLLLLLWLSVVLLMFASIRSWAGGFSGSGFSGSKFTLGKCSPAAR
jgi:uncharacterized RDD family membrane protein YckC